MYEHYSYNRVERGLVVDVYETEYLGMNQHEILTAHLAARARGGSELN